MAIAEGVLIGIVVGWFTACLVAGTLGKRADDAVRRTGWNYGYGQGVVDGKRGVYRPGAPPDGRAWKGVRP